MKNTIDFFKSQLENNVLDLNFLESKMENEWIKYLYENKIIKQYTLKNKEKIFLPHIFFYGTLVMNNIYDDSFVIYLRYSTLENSKRETLDATRVLEEITDRIEESEKIIKTLPFSKIVKAKELKNELIYLRRIFSAGLILQEEMINKKLGKDSIEDKKILSVSNNFIKIKQ